MTVTSEDRADYESVTASFRPQPTPDMCFTACLKNILDEIFNRHDVDGHEISLNRLNDIFDYREWNASSTENIPAKLDPVISDIGFNAKVASGLEIEDLQTIISDPNRSYPLVELDKAYFDSIEDWDPRPGGDGYEWTHVVIPHTVNDEDILFYDPFGDIMLRSGNVESPPTERSQTQFYEWWSAPETRWTMWIQQKGQRTLSSPEFRSDSNEWD